MSESRTDVDYVIEFGRSLATAAAQFMNEQNRAVEANESPDAAYWHALKSAIYEFRKRAERAEKTVNLVRRLAYQRMRSAALRQEEGR